MYLLINTHTPAANIIRRYKNKNEHKEVKLKDSFLFSGILLSDIILGCFYQNLYVQQLFPV